MKPSQESFAEIIESSLTECVAQCWEWDRMPLFGSLIMIREDTCIIFGVVHKIETGSLDAIRTPFAYRKTQEELKKEQPHIFEFLKTTFSCVLVGYREKSSMAYMMVPQPPKIHSFVGVATSELAKHFFSSSDFLYVLFALQNTISYMDELLLALLTQGIKHSHIDAHCVRACLETYMMLIGNEYRRTKLFAQRVQQILTQ